MRGLIFLDFDGVTHPYFPRSDLSDAENQHFSFLPRIAAVLRTHPEIQVVVSSDWRRERTLTELRVFFPKDIRHRVIGKTPVLFERQSFPDGEREKEVLAWLKDNEHLATPWLALDDVPENYTKNAPLIICHDGFFDREENLLFSALLQFKLPIRKLLVP